MFRPPSVTHAVQAIWLINGISLLTIILNASDPEATTDALIFNLLLLAFYAVITWQIGAGKARARLMYAGLVAFEVALVAAFGMDGASDLDQLAVYFTTPLELWALYKLFRPESDAWFKERQRNH